LRFQPRSTRASNVGALYVPSASHGHGHAFQNFQKSVKIFQKSVKM
jgi:hypothetical protein